MVEHKRILIKTWDIFEEYVKNTHGYVIGDDLDEIITQCFMLLINTGEFEEEAAIFPDLGRLRRNQFLNDEMITRIITDETKALFSALVNRLYEYRILEEPKCVVSFNYYFAQLVNGDILLEYLNF